MSAEIPFKKEDLDNCLIVFDEEHPGELKGENINDIIKQAREKQQNSAS